MDKAQFKKTVERLLAFAGVIVKLTPTPHDNAVVALLQGVVQDTEVLDLIYDLLLAKGKLPPVT
jgi:hypothetical protein